jgi:conjugal transfer mating pair stabilization protein TraN
MVIKYLELKKFTKREKTIMRNLILFIAFSFTSLFAIDCNSMSSVTTFNGHYYAKTSSRTSYDAIRVSAVNDNGYLAIPNSVEENTFIKSLVGGNTEAWIGVFDPNYARNYCYDNATCFFDDTRFRDVKGQVITYRNWASYEPNNFVESSDMENNLAAVDPLGENWVIMNGNTGQWYDVGNHKNSNQNPRKHVAIVEFDENQYA